ncbi:hypothetical protein niasHT_035080 [Heterodera trifolii]|uniref:Peptidase S1 domain-containing protein n=1 Tax=Heterodera trifolii TaxID=157864 RepID=A0ABD2IHJ3_9BILA
MDKMLLLVTFLVIFIGVQQRKVRELRRCSMPMSRFMFGSETGPYDNATYFVHFLIKNRNGIMSKCSGVLFNPSLVLTCAHCWKNAQTDGDGSMMAYAGIEDGQSVEESVSKKVVSFVLHPAFRLLNGASFDLAVVEVLTFELVSGKLGTIGFPRFERVYTSNQLVDCQIAGKEVINNELSLPTFYKKRAIVHKKRGQMRKHEAPALYDGHFDVVSCCNVAISRLGKTPGHKFPMGTICLGGHSDAACAGDSGSGVVCKYEPTGDRVLVGVLRAGAQCCDKSGLRLNEPGERNIIQLDIACRSWISRVALHHFRCGSLTPPCAPALAYSARASKEYEDKEQGYL